MLFVCFLIITIWPFCQAILSRFHKYLLIFILQNMSLFSCYLFPKGNLTSATATATALSGSQWAMYLGKNASPDQIVSYISNKCETSLWTVTELGAWGGAGPQVALREVSGGLQPSLCSFIDGRPLLLPGVHCVCSTLLSKALLCKLTHRQRPALLCDPYCVVYSPLICPNSHPAYVHHSPRAHYVLLLP